MKLININLFIIFILENNIFIKVEKLPPKKLIKYL